ncbi:hypothetical protein L226DRAFT_527447 [Lentinus tigrinus ALCF2SS1-7]|uniref:Uncharacterized protein n=1 Tax=Lentinus tigrinus ALCF2SS1-6 TaxID=1328759 RepID=A0A5C2RQW4_9APHY|nr:hypothetical protein L227DRAFT_568318 [Lentinus tigrinus ALCF2SS1-6]RPD68115.1 hypothetical protein L226DRAFT_527447 [Lentinus tigrinus ALCF2SS1-7]
MDHRSSSFPHPTLAPLSKDAPSNTPPHEDTAPVDVASDPSDLRDLQEHFSSLFLPLDFPADCSDYENEDEGYTAGDLDPIWTRAGVITDDELTKGREEASAHEKIRMLMSRPQDPGMLVEASQPKNVVVEGTPQWAVVEEVDADFAPEAGDVRRMAESPYEAEELETDDARAELLRHVKNGMSPGSHYPHGQKRSSHGGSTWAAMQSMYFCQSE